MRVAVIEFPGTNRAKDMTDALKRVGASFVKQVNADDRLADGFDLIVLPGGFAHGDYLRPGAIAAHAPIICEIRRQLDRGVRIAGVCNGFQILCEAGILPGAIVINRDGRFICRSTTVIVGDGRSVFLSEFEPGERIRVLIAHQSGNFQASPSVLERLEGDGRIAFHYSENPNGSLRDIAGITGENDRVIGLMPHPENELPELMIAGARTSQSGEDGNRLLRAFLNAPGGER